MSDLWVLFLKGFGLGFSIAAPVGPIGVLCIQRSLNKGFLSGLVSGLGAAAADLIYGALAGFGAMWLGNQLVQLQTPLRVVGGLVLVGMGLRAFLKKEQESTVEVKDHGYFKDFVSTFLLTLTNPMTIISFTAVYAGIGLSDVQTSLWSIFFLIMGVFLGSASWWLTLSSLVSVLHGRFEQRFYRIINKIAGIVILGFGLSLLISLV